MDIKTQLQKDIQAAMKAGDSVKRETLRGLLAAHTNAEIEVKGELSQDDFTNVVNREVKKRREAIEAFKAGGREDRMKKETRELEILQTYLPEQLSSEEIKMVVQSIIDSLNAQGAPGLGQVMGQAMGKLKGKADGNTVRKIVSDLLEG